MLDPHHLDVLLAKKLAGETSKEEDVLLNEWIEKNPQDWKQAQEAYQNASASLFNFEPKALKIPSAPTSTPTFHFPYRWLAAAASLILIAMISFFLIRENEVSTFAKLIETKTQLGEQKELNLPDGSTVRLNAASVFRYPEDFSENKREVYLEGEAYFEVQTDRKRPFLIHGTEANVNVLGTAFNVSAYAAEPMVVSVRSGRISMVSHSEKGAEALLVPMMKRGVSDKNKGIWQVERAEEKDFGWLEDRLVFDQTELKVVLKTLSRHYGVTLQLNSPQLATCRISATFDRNTIEEVMETLSLIVDLQVEPVNGGYAISGKGC